MCCGVSNLKKDGQDYSFHVCHNRKLIMSPFDGMTYIFSCVQDEASSSIGHGGHKPHTQCLKDSDCSKVDPNTCCGSSIVKQNDRNIVLTLCDLKTATTITSPFNDGKTYPFKCLPPPKEQIKLALNDKELLAS